MKNIEEQLEKISEIANELRQEKERNEEIEMILIVDREL